jgi:hypothetical protein
MGITVNYILRLLVILMGALEIRYAIKWYHEGYYFLCGFNIMFTFYMIMYLYELVVLI